MPLIVRDTSYELPGSDGRTGPTGAEIDTIETFFGVDYYDLMAMLTSQAPDGPKPPARPGCTRNRAFYALAWMAMHRVDDTATLAAVMEEYGRDELSFQSGEPTPAEEAKGDEVPTPAGDEATESAATS